LIAASLRHEGAVCHLRRFARHDARLDSGSCLWVRPVLPFSAARRPADSMLWLFSSNDAASLALRVGLLATGNAFTLGADAKDNRSVPPIWLRCVQVGERGKEKKKARDQGRRESRGLLVSRAFHPNLISGKPPRDQFKDLEAQPCSRDLQSRFKISITCETAPCSGFL
jgi:hypothetical protein